MYFPLGANSPASLQNGLLRLLLVTILSYGAWSAAVASAQQPGGPLLTERVPRAADSDLAPSPDVSELDRRLARQEAEIRELRARLLSADAPPVSNAPVDNAPRSELDLLRARIDALEQQGAVTLQPPAREPAAAGAAGSGSGAGEQGKANAEAAAPAAAKAADGAKKADGKPDDGGWIDMSGEKWNVKLGGHVQMDYVNWANASPSIIGQQDYFEFRRLRVVADGVGYGLYDFRLQMTLEPESVGESPAGAVTSPEVKDAYLSMNEIPWLGRMRIGNFFVPFSLEQVTNDTNNTLWSDPSPPKACSPPIAK